MTIHPTYKKSLILFGLAANLVACDLIEPRGFQKVHLNEEVHLDNVHTPTQKDALANQKNNAKNELQQEPYEIYKGSGNFVEKQNDRKPTSRKGSVTLNFENADLVEVVRVILNDSLKVNYVIDPRVTGKVSLRTARPLAEDELLSTLEMLLQINNATLVKNGNNYKIQIQSNELGGAKGLPKLSGSSLGAGSQVRIIPLLFVGAKQMNEILKPVLSNNALLRADTARNLLMVAGTAEEIGIIEETVNIFDVNTMQGMSFGLFPLNSVDPETINKELAEVFGYNAEGPLEDMFRIVPIERLNSILVITPQPQYLEQIKVWLSRLDRTKKGDGGNVHVYRAQHMKALDLANTLNDIFGQGRVKSKLKTAVKKGSVVPNQKSASVTNKSSTTNSTSSNMAGNSSSAALDANSNSSSSSSSSNSNSNGTSNENNKEKVSTSDVRIIADELNNSLIIVANDLDYKNVRTLINQLDIMPLQVHIDASILAVTLDDSTKYGVEWLLNDGTGTSKLNNQLGGNANGVTSAMTRLASNAPVGGFSYMLNQAKDIQATLYALSNKANVHVISSPSLMVLNNQEASIQVGDKIPVRTSQSTNTSSAVIDPNNINNPINAIQTSGIEMIETGVTLNVTPRVNASGVVIMDIEQSVDDATRTTVSAIDSPTILKRSIKTTVAVDNNETIVLGGLIAETTDDNKTGIPLLMDIPLVGDLFSTTGRSKQRKELVVLITPQVLQNKNDARAVALEYKQRLQGIYQ